ncbi:MAG: HNH endonuclease [Spirochaetia bacterium]|nr:HNH endonuclease [Spirochaetia bacterium]
MKEIFEKYIDKKLSRISTDFIDLNSGSIHREIGGYPNNNHRMPECCEVMYSKMKGNDSIISSPPKGKGASLTIRYFKQNHQN